MTPRIRRSSPELRLSSAGASALGSLLAGLDELEPIFTLPDAPARAEVPLPFGRYRLLARLGSGRFGIVLLAEEAALARLVAVKVPSPTALTEPELRERFIREGRAAAVLDHPGIVSVFEAGEERGLPYLVAAYVAGPSLLRWRELHPGPVDPRDAGQLVAALAEAIHHAHEHGVLHCDLSPSNVLLHPTNALSDRLSDHRPAVTDFGFARVLSDDPSKTRSACIVGTPLYMSPEQARGERRNLSARTDVYALGAILYDLLTGSTPFRGTDSQLVLDQVLNGLPARPRSLVQSLSRDLEAVCLKCLEKDPARRYASAAALAEDLHRFLRNEPTLARPVGVIRTSLRWARRRPVVALTGLLATVAWGAIPAIVVDYRGKLDSEAANRRAAEDIAREADRRSEASAFYASLERIRQRRANPVPGWADEAVAEIRTLARHPNAAEATVELRSEAAAALAATDLRPIRTLADGFSAYAAAYAPDGRSLALAGWHWSELPRSAHVLIVQPETGQTIRELTAVLDPSWARLEGVPDGLRSIAFSPDGRWLVAGSRSGQLVRWDQKEAAPPPVVWPAHSGELDDRRKIRVAKLHFSACGDRLYSSTGHTTRIWNVKDQWKPVEPAPLVFVATSGGSLESGRVPVMRGRTDTSELSLFDPATGEVQGLGVTGGSDFATTNDGRLAAVHSDAEPVFSLVAMEPGARPVSFRSPDRARDERLSITHLSFSPDNSLLATSEEHEKRLKLWDVSAGQLLVDRSIGGGSGRFAFSPDGQHLVITEDSRTVLYSITGRLRETLAVGPRRWARAMAAGADGQRLAVLASDRYEKMELATWDASPGTAPRLRRLQRLDVQNTSNIRVCMSPQDDLAYITGAPSGTKDSRDWIHRGKGRAEQVEAVSDLAFAPDGHLWIADQHRIRIAADAATGVRIVQENDALSRAAGMVFRRVVPGRTLTLIGRRDGMIFLREPSGDAIASPAVSSAVSSLALAADESHAIVGGESGEVVVLDRSGALLHSIRPHRDEVTSVLATPSGWISASADRTIRFFDRELRHVCTLNSVGPVEALALTSDGRCLTILVRGERGVRRWRLDRLAEEWARLGL